MDDAHKIAAGHSAEAVKNLEAADRYLAIVVSRINPRDGETMALAKLAHNSVRTILENHNERCMASKD